MPYSEGTITAANAAALSYIEGGVSVEVRVYTSADVFLWAATLPAGVQQANGGVLWGETARVAVTTGGTAAKATVTRVNDGDLVEHCITLPVQTGSSPVPGYCVLSTGTLSLAQGEEIGASSVLMPGAEE